MSTRKGPPIRRRGGVADPGVSSPPSAMGRRRGTHVDTPGFAGLLSEEAWGSNRLVYSIYQADNQLCNLTGETGLLGWKKMPGLPAPAWS
jgi:hypothetical protein